MRRRSPGARSVLGRSIRLDDQSYTVVGVMPPQFKFWAAELWVPIGLNFDATFHESRVVRNGVFGVGRLRPGISLEQARAEMNLIAERLEQTYPESNEGIRVEIMTLAEFATGEIRPALLMLLGAVGFVLLIACANVANLLLVRAASREKEIALRSSLGAHRARLLRQMLTESLLLSALGAMAGVVIAHWSIRGMLAVVPVYAIPIEAEIGLDLRVLTFTAVLAIATAVLFGLAPAWQATRSDVRAGLRDGVRGATAGSSGQRLGSLLIVSEVALSLALLVGAGLLLNSFRHLQAVDTRASAARTCSSSM